MILPYAKERWNRVRKDAINLCELDNVEVDQALVNKIISDENRMPTKLGRINSYTTCFGAKAWETITDYFKEYM